MAKYEYYVVKVEAEKDDSDDLEAELAREVEWMVDWECWDGVVTSFWGGPYGDKNVGRRSESFAQRLLDDENLPALLEPSGLFVLGHTKRDTLETPATWLHKKTLKHGDTLIEIVRLAKC